MRRLFPIPHNISSEFFRRTWLAFLSLLNGSHRSSVSAARVCDRLRREESGRRKKKRQPLGEAASFKSSD
jgi:hypothetical protein